MPRKPDMTHYSEFRNVCEGIKGGRTRLKIEVVPGFATFLLMLSKRYLKAAESLAHKNVRGTVPGAKEGAERMAWACQHVQMIADAMPHSFNRKEWEEAAAEMCDLLGIKPGDAPMWDISDGKMVTAFKGLPDGDEQSDGAAALEPSVEPPAPPIDTIRHPPAKRQRRRRKGNVGSAPG